MPKRKPKRKHYPRPRKRLTVAQRRKRRRASQRRYYLRVKKIRKRHRAYLRKRRPYGFTFDRPTEKQIDAIIIAGMGDP